MELTEQEADTNQCIHKIKKKTKPKDGEIEKVPTPVDNEEDSVFMRGYKLPIGELEQIPHRGEGSPLYTNEHFVNQLLTNKKIIEVSIKKAEVAFHAGLKNSNIKNNDRSRNDVHSSMQLEDKDTTPEIYKPDFETLSIR